MCDERKSNSLRRRKGHINCQKYLTNDESSISSSFSRGDVFHWNDCFTLPSFAKFVVSSPSVGVCHGGVVGQSLGTNRHLQCRRSAAATRASPHFTVLVSTGATIEHSLLDFLQHFGWFRSGRRSVAVQRRSLGQSAGARHAASARTCSTEFLVGFRIENSTRLVSRWISRSAVRSSTWNPFRRSERAADQPEGRRSSGHLSVLRVRSVGLELDEFHSNSSRFEQSDRVRRRLRLDFLPSPVDISLETLFVQFDFHIVSS